MTKEQILAEAMALPAKEREQVAEELWISINHSNSSEVEKAWIEEAERRLDSLERGESETIPGDQVMRDLLAKYSG